MEKIVNTASKSNSRSVWIQSLLFGITFECVLIAVQFAGEPQGSFFIELHNLAEVSHYPFFRLVDLFRVDSEIIGTICMILYVLLMVFVWTFGYYWLRQSVLARLTRNGISKHKQLLMLLGFAILAVTIAARQFADYHFDHPTPFAPSSEAKSVAEGNNAFALDLYNRLKGQPENLFFSPYSISAGMGMVWAGARGQTGQEIAGVMHFKLPQNSLHTAFGELGGRMNNVQHWNHLTLREANSFWFQRDYPLMAAFTNLIRVNYDAEGHAVDFAHSAQHAGEEISAWIEKKTGGRIKRACDAAGLGPDTRLALCNAIYFKGEWANQFKRSQTESAPFHISTNESITVPMMRQKAHFRIVHDNDFDFDDEHKLNLLEMPYYGRDISMVILLPQEKDGLAALEQQLTLAQLNSWLGMLDAESPHEANIALPRFTIRRNIDMVPRLKESGITSLFDGNADLSSMEPTKNLKVSDFLHEAFVEVNEHGTEATAMNLVVAKTKGITDHLWMDHPFIFLIRENTTGSILFLGRMLDPTKQ